MRLPSCNQTNGSFLTQTFNKVHMLSDYNGYCLFQDKGVSIIIVGIIKKGTEKTKYIENNMRRMAGEKGKELEYQNFF